MERLHSKPVGFQVASSGVRSSRKKMLATAVEGKAAPCLSHESDNLVERDLPLPISRAITRTMTWRDGEYARLGQTERGMLVEVLRCIPKAQPSQAAFIRRDTLATRLDCSLAKVTRLLARLEELGWIIRDQVKSRIRGFQVGSISLSSAAISWLGLDTPVQAQRRSQMSDASSLSVQSFRRQPPQAGATPEKALPNKPTQGGQARVPQALQWLLDGMTAWGVYKLMGLARKRGVLLETITNQCEAQIRAAKDRFGYIRGLVGLDKDWAYLAEQGRAVEEQAAQQSANQSRLADAALSLEGRSFIGHDGDVRRVLSGWVSVYSPAEAAKSLGTPKGSRPLSLALLDELDAGTLKPWELRSSSTQDSEPCKTAPSAGGSLFKADKTSHIGSALLEAIAGLKRPLAFV